MKKFNFKIKNIFKKKFIKKDNTKLTSLLIELRKKKKLQLEICQQMIKAYNSTLYPLDLLAMGAVKRSLFLIRGFCDLIESRNLYCAAPVLRMQLDNALRFYAAFIVDEPHEFASKIMSGEKIRDLRDKNHKKMTDSHLVSELSKEYNWITSVYEETCAFVHLSDKHIFNTMKNINEKERTVECSISEFDFSISEERYQEAVEAFIAVTNIFNRYLNGWVFTKDNPKIINKLRQEMKP